MVIPSRNIELSTVTLDETESLLPLVCPYEVLNLRPDPKTSTETYELWNWDVAEVFVGADFNDIKRYKEFEVSPQGEWVDFDMDLKKPHHEEGWKWNSGLQVSARIDRGAHVWYAAMKIPYAVDTRRAAAGNTLRIKFFAARDRLPVVMRLHGRLRWLIPFTSPIGLGFAIGQVVRNSG